MTRIGVNGWLRNAREVVSIFLTVVTLGVIMGFTYWIFNQPQYAAGPLISVHAIEGSARSLMLVKPPGCEAKAIVIEGKVTPTPHISWVLAKGETRIVEFPITQHLSKRVPVLEAEKLQTLSIWPSEIVASGVDWPYRIEGLLRQHRGAAALTGAAILVLGLFFLRLTSAVILGSMGALLSWHLAVLGEWEGLISLPAGGMKVVLLLGFVLGGLIGFRKSIPGYLVQRLGIILIMMDFADNIAVTFGWPVELTRRVTVLGSLVSPAIGVWLLAAYFLSLGLDTRGPAGHLVLGAAGMIVHILNRGKWIPGLSELPRLRVFTRWFPRKRSATQSHEVPLGDLVR